MKKDKDIKLQALKLAMEKIDKTYGKGSIMKLGDMTIEKVDSISTGSISIDAALGVGGLPKGRIIEIFGPESSGKTTLTIHAIAECQKSGGIAAFIDAEHAFDRIYAENLGVDIDNLVISQPDNGEQALEIADNLIRSGAIDLIIIDSVAALTPKSEIDGEMGDASVGVQARLMSKALRKMTASISKTGATCVFINQLRSNGMNKLIFDLRTNSGGYLEQAVNISDLFITSNDTIVYTSGRKDKITDSFKASSKKGFDDFSLIILINRWSASASEIVAGAVQDLDRGLILGETSFGKGLVQGQWPLRDGSAV